MSVTYRLAILPVKQFMWQIWMLESSESESALPAISTD